MLKRARALVGHFKHSGKATMALNNKQKELMADGAFPYDRPAGDARPLKKRRPTAAATAAAVAGALVEAAAHYATTPAAAAGGGT